MCLDVDKHGSIDQIDCITTLKDLNKEVKSAEKISMKVNPPKPERESNRRRKKKSLDDDFIDLSDPSSMYLYDWNERRTQSGKKHVKKKSDSTGGGKSENVVKPGTPVVDKELEKIMENHNKSFSYENTQKRTVSPLRLSLTPAARRQEARTPEEVQRGPEEEDDKDRFDLTDRDAVRQLMVNRKHSEMAANNLNNALDDAMTEFGVTDDSLVTDDDLVIDESPRAKKKKPLKLRLSVGSLSEFNVENGSSPSSTFNKFNNQTIQPVTGNHLNIRVIICYKESCILIIRFED